MLSALEKAPCGSLYPVPNVSIVQNCTYFLSLFQPRLQCNILSAEGACPNLTIPSGPYPSAVTNLYITASTSPNTTLASPNITWGLPDNATSFLHVKAFQLEFYNWSREGDTQNLVSCHVFNLTGVEWQTEDQSLQYRYVFVSVQQ